MSNSKKMKNIVQKPDNQRQIWGKYKKEKKKAHKVQICADWDAVMRPFMYFKVKFV